MSVAADQTQVVRFTANPQLKQQLEQAARDRNISLAAFMRLISTEYIRNTKRA